MTASNLLHPPLTRFRAPTSLPSESLSSVLLRSYYLPFALHEPLRQAAPPSMRYRMQRHTAHDSQPSDHALVARPPTQAPGHSIRYITPSDAPFRFRPRARDWGQSFFQWEVDQVPGLPDKIDTLAARQLLSFQFFYATFVPPAFGPGFSTRFYSFSVSLPTSIVRFRPSVLAHRLRRPSKG